MRGIREDCVKKGWDKMCDVSAERRTYTSEGCLGGVEFVEGEDACVSGIQEK